MTYNEQFIRKLYGAFILSRHTQNHIKSFVMYCTKLSSMDFMKAGFVHRSRFISLSHLISYFILSLIDMDMLLFFLFVILATKHLLDEAVYLLVG